MLNIRPFDWSDEDYGVVVDVSNANFPDELDLPELLRHRDNARDQNYMLERVILEVDSESVGSGSFGESMWTPMPGKFWTFEHYDIIPDLICMGKGISSSLPVSGVLG